MKTIEVLLHTEGFAARAELSTLAERKAAKLFRHAGWLERLRVNIVRETLRGSEPRFAVIAVLERAGADAVIHATAAHPEIALGEAFDKLERIVAARTDARLHARRHPVSPEPSGALPKACVS
ncbi:MAG TPA: hypothetical protein VGD81_00200 [Opitutaceae bacterium]